MEELKNEFSWVKEKFEKNEIKISLEHQSYAKSIFEGIDNNRKFEYFLELFMTSLYLYRIVEVPEFRGVGSYCNECGELVMYQYDIDKCELVDYTTNSETGAMERGVCSVIKDYTFEVSFPTGKIICADRLPNSYDMLKELDSTRHTLNSNLGLKERTLAYADANILHVFVGNTCPDVFKKDDTLVIGHSSNNECEDCRCGVENCSCAYQEYPPIEGAETIANICTDLWWASIVDVSVYEKLLIDYFGEEKGREYMNEITPTKTEIKPGVYECTYHVQEDFDCADVYVTFKWVREI